MTFVATHYPELKLYAHSTPGVQNASMEFDVDTLAPTYKLMIGLPGRSNAFAIARRLHMPESIVKRAQGMISGEELRAEDMLADLHKLRIQEVRARDTAREADREAEQAQKHYGSASPISMRSVIKFCKQAEADMAAEVDVAAHRVECFAQKDAIDHGDRVTNRMFVRLGSELEHWTRL